LFAPSTCDQRVQNAECKMHFQGALQWRFTSADSKLCEQTVNALAYNYFWVTSLVSNPEKELSSLIPRAWDFHRHADG